MFFGFSYGEVIVTVAVLAVVIGAHKYACLRIVAQHCSLGLLKLCLVLFILNSDISLLCVVNFNEWEKLLFYHEQVPRSCPSLQGLLAE